MADLPLVLFTGSRDWPNFNRVGFIMLRLRTIIGQYRPLHGGARGVDTFVDVHAHRDGFPEPIVDLPDYANYGRYAAPKRRNTTMLQRQPILVVAFWREGSTTGGTLDCIDKAVNTFRIPLLLYRS